MGWATQRAYKSREHRYTCRKGTEITFGKAMACCLMSGCPELKVMGRAIGHVGPMGLTAESPSPALPSGGRV
jgi:hypothetical protein